MVLKSKLKIFIQPGSERDAETQDILLHVLEPDINQRAPERDTPMEQNDLWENIDHIQDFKVLTYILS